MRPLSMFTTTKVLITAFALILSLAGFTEARDRTETLSGVTAGSHHHKWRHPGKHRLVGRTKYHRHGERHYGERRFAHDRRPNRRIVAREYRGNSRNYWEPAYRNGGNGFPSYITGGAYLGGISAWQQSGNGIYFSREGNVYDYGYEPADNDRAYRGHRAKIIRVNPSSAGRACSWESGVCVIRR